MEHSTEIEQRPNQPLNLTRRKAVPPIVSTVGYSGSGKTTLLEKLIAELKQRGFRVGTIKHDVHGFEMDRPGKDSWRHKQAGASVTVISSPYQIGMVKD
ncbi:MAG: molybdopterin-guanine dinucleotide biosynthesis protein B, partial [Desulfobacterales bacterium]